MSTSRSRWYRADGADSTAIRTSCARAPAPGAQAPTLRQPRLSGSSTGHQEHHISCTHGSFRPPEVSGEAARGGARYDHREQSGSEPLGETWIVSRRATRFSTATRTSTIPCGIWDHVPESKKELVRNTYWRGDNEAWLNGTRRHGRRQRPLPRLQPDLHRGPADEQEDHAEAQLDAAHRRTEGVPPPRRRHRPGRPSPRDGPHGHRPGAGDPHDGHHARALRDERGRRRRVLRGLQRLRRRVVQRREQSPLRRRLPSRARRPRTRSRRSSGRRGWDCQWVSSGRSTRRPSTPMRRRRR